MAQQCGHHRLIFLPHEAPACAGSAWMMPAGCILELLLLPFQVIPRKPVSTQQRRVLPQPAGADGVSPAFLGNTAGSRVLAIWRVKHRAKMQIISPWNCKHKDEVKRENVKETGLASKLQSPDLPEKVRRQKCFSDSKRPWNVAI